MLISVAFSFSSRRSSWKTLRFVLSFETCLLSVLALKKTVRKSSVCFRFDTARNSGDRSFIFLCFFFAVISSLTREFHSLGCWSRLCCVMNAAGVAVEIVILHVAIYKVLVFLSLFLPKLYFTPWLWLESCLFESEELDILIVLAPFLFKSNGQPKVMVTWL